MKVFVTGGAGYVGSHCVRGLCEAGHEVVVYDNLRYGGHKAAVDSRATLVIGDLCDRDVLNESLSPGFDAVVHFAAFTDVGESVRDPMRYYRNNVVHSVGLLEAVRDHAIKTLIFSSSCSVYGIPPALPITEDMPRQPINPYGRTKLAIEWAMEDAAAAWGLGATALRYFNAAGAAADGSLGEDHTPESHLIPRVLRVAQRKSEGVKIFGVDYPTPDGSCIRDYVHVEDLAAIHRIAIETQPEGEFRCFNVGTGLGVSVKELIQVAREVTGLDITATPAPRREGDPAELYADPTLAMTELGWKPAYTDIRAIVQTAWAWHSTHPDGFKSIPEKSA